ncbi:pentatricopeptide repeat-containing protein At5g43790 [Lolium perenne]|uniref:pentatricopeptide repeat-containing protein At5g43790 n=1 Tax=Lolium perenne TaxID=4522 RepID=UPI0021EAA94D|nr:pentatricopeptide repeat-containing protein At5g43790-like [Lolium perenne]
MSPDAAPSRHSLAADPLPALRRLRAAAPRVFGQLHALLLTTGLALHSPNFALLLRLASSSSVSHRLQLLLCSPLQPTAFLANSLLLAHLPSALPLYCVLFLGGAALLRPNEFTYPALLRASPPRAALALATHSIKFLGAGAASRDRVLGAALLDAFARCGRIVPCRRVFDRIVEPDLPAWNALLTVYARRRAADEAAEILDLFGRMVVSSTVRPNEITLVAVISACGELGALGHGLWAHTYLLRRRLAVNCFVATALVEMYTRCGRMDLAEQVFASVDDDMDTRCYNAMLQGLAFHGHGRAALTLFERMCAQGFLVDSVTVLAVMCACAHAGLVDEGQWLFDKMEVQFGVAPRIEHYGCMVDILGRAGRLDDAEKLIRGMDIPPNAAMYRSLIRACGIHGKLELGERMIGELVRLEPEQSGNYVLMSNFYARMRLWEDAKKARKEMKDMGIDKSPGSSLLDIDGVLHEFLMGDKTHPASREIYAMVQEIEARLNECGHRPSTTAVLFNVEEEDKADALSYHSERLAIAFALIASPQGSPIRIIKNLRVCSDCHDSTKLVSRLYGREIIMRDRTRFHHFRDGRCSCGDFW